jgi:sugar transferase (PEP-CTERM/EpsH1 system associated)
LNRWEPNQSKNILRIDISFNSRKLKLLFIANRFPYPPFRGDKLKIYNLCKRLAVDHEIHLITFLEQKSDLQYLHELNPIFKQIHLIRLPKIQSLIHVALGLFQNIPLQVKYFRSRRFEKKLAIILANEKFDAIHVQHLRMAQYAIPYKEFYRILDMPDAFSLYWQRRKEVQRSVFSRFLDNIESKRVYNYEKYILNEFDLNLVCSKEDQIFLKETHHIDHIELLPNGVDTDQFKPKNHDYKLNQRLLFTGNMDYAPNVDAVVYFAEEVFPLIQKVHPNVSFTIAGQRPIDKVKELANIKGIEVTGFIQDLSEMYNSASVVVAPLRFGAGTQNKVLEAMAMGIPVVCSNIGFAGLGIEDGEGAFMRIGAEYFAEQVVELLDSQTLREKTGRKGVEVIQTSFSWDTIAKTLEGYFLNAK